MRAAMRVLGWLSVLPAAVALTAGPAVGVPPAVAAEDELGLSLDGATWAPTLSTPLFDPGMAWVPGDVETTTLYARNESGVAATAVAGVLVDDCGGVLADDLLFRTLIGDGPWTEGSVSRVIRLGPGEVLPIGVEVAFDPAATNASARQTTGLDVVVTLIEAGAEVPRAPGDQPCRPPGGGSGSLPRTGANLLLPILVAIGSVVLGDLLLRKSRRG